MKIEGLSDSIAKASPGDGTYAGARKLYLTRALKMTLIERLRAVEQMAETARFIREARRSQGVEDEE